MTYKYYESKFKWYNKESDVMVTERKQVLCENLSDYTDKPKRLTKKVRKLYEAVDALNGVLPSDATARPYYYDAGTDEACYGVMIHTTQEGDPNSGGDRKFLESRASRGKDNPNSEYYNFKYPDGCVSNHKAYPMNGQIIEPTFESLIDEVHRMVKRYSKGDA